jgi:hypothetical protein
LAHIEGLSSLQPTPLRFLARLRGKGTGWYKEGSDQTAFL